MPTNIIDKLAQFVVEFPLQDIPSDTLHTAYLASIDTMGVALAGLEEPTADKTAAMVGRWGGTEEATVWGRSKKLPVALAALANGTAGHALDFDDLDVSVVGHPSTVLVPAAMALAEKLGASGEQMLASYVIGYEVMGMVSTLVNPTHYESGWHATATLGTMAAAATACRLMGLTVEQTANALALSVSEMSAVRRNFGTMAKPFHAGSAAFHGVMVAELAESGFTANPEVLNPDSDFYTLYNAPENPPFERVDQIGTDWFCRSLGFKRFPCCGGTHTALDSLLELRAEEQLNVEQIKKVTIAGPSLLGRILIYDAPATGLEGKFSMPYTAACALIDGEVGLRHFYDDQVARPELIALAAKTELVGDDSITLEDGGFGLPAKVTVEMVDGSHLERFREYANGSPHAPMSDQQLVDKFELNLQLYTADKNWQAGFSELMQKLPQLGDITELTGQL